MPRIGIAAIVEQSAVGDQRVGLVEVALHDLGEVVRRDLRVGGFLEHLEVEALARCDRAGDFDVAVAEAAVHVDARRHPRIAQEAERQPRIEPAGKRALNGLTEMVDVNPCRPAQPLRLLGETLLEGCPRYVVGEGFGDGLGANPHAELDLRIRP